MKNVNLLLVDDRPGKLHALENLITEHLPGCRLLAVASGEEGLAAASENELDCAVINARLPGMSGIEMCRRLKRDERTAGAPVILIIPRRSNSQLKAEGLQAGADDFLNQPIDLLELIARIKVMLRIKQAEDDLRASNARLKQHETDQTQTPLHERDKVTAILEAMSDGVYIVDGNYDIQLANAALRAEFGSPEGRKCYEYFHNRKKPCPLCNNPEVFNGQSFRWEWHSPTNQKIYDAIDTPLKNSDGSISKLEILRDITERKRAEEKLRNLYAEQQLIFDTAPAMIWYKDLENRVLRVNRAGAESVGMTVQQIEGKSAYELFPNEAEKYFQDDLEVIETGKSKRDIIERLQTTSGEKLWVSTDKILLRNKRGDATGLLTFVVDITERKRAEEALQTTQKYLVKAQQIAKSGSWAWEKHQDAGYFSDETFQLLGYAVNEIQPSFDWLSRIMHPDDVEPVRAGIAESMSTGKPYEMEYRLTKKDGEEIIVHSQAEVTFSEKGEATGMIGAIQDITERKQAEKELRKSETRFRTSVENMLDCFGVYSAIRDESGRIVDFRIEYVNDAACENNRMTKEEQIGKRLCELLPAHRETGLFDEYCQVVETGESIEKESLFYEDVYDGTRLIRAFDIRMVKLDDGFAAAWRDITERRRAEEELRRYEQIVSSSSDMLALIDKNFVYLAANEAYVKAFGKTREELVGLTVREVFGEEFFETVIRPNAELCLAGEEVHYQAWFEFPASGRQCMDVAYFPYRDAAQEVQGFVVSSRNVTEQKQAEEELKRLFELSPDMICTASADGFFKSLNPAWEEVLGFTREELLAKPFNDFIHPDDIDATTDTLDEQIAGKPIISFENRYRCKDGSYKLLEWRSTPVVEGVVYAIARDITERRRAVEALKDSREQFRLLAAHLQSVREEERTLIARAIHDELGQALTALKMDLSRQAAREAKNQPALLKKTQAMLALVNATAQKVKRISAELRPGLLDDLGITAAIEWQVGEFKERTGVKCQLKIHPEEIALSRESSTALFRIFQETLTNIARHAKATNVKVNLTGKPNEIELIVVDDGLGITSAQIVDPRAWGIIGMKERALVVAGDFKISARRGKGTKVRIVMPVQQTE